MLSAVLSYTFDQNHRERVIPMNWLEISHRSRRSLYLNNRERTPTRFTVPVLSPFSVSVLDRTI